MRHAKSSWTDSSISDHERPLNARGERSATAVGETLTARGLAPDLIWASDAKRTRMTALLLIRAIPGAQQIEYLPEFYHASAQNVLEVCAQREEPQRSLMLLGHNPGWAALHEYFTGQHHAYPTGACTILTRLNETSPQETSWLSPQNWRLTDFILPRELEE